MHFFFSDLIIAFRIYKHYNANELKQQFILDNKHALKVADTCLQERKWDLYNTAQNLAIDRIIYFMYQGVYIDIACPKLKESGESKGEVTVREGNKIDFIRRVSMLLI